MLSFENKHSSYLHYAYWGIIGDIRAMIPSVGSNDLSKLRYHSVKRIEIVLISFDHFGLNITI